MDNYLPSLFFSFLWSFPGVDKKRFLKRNKINKKEKNERKREKKEKFLN